MRKFVVYRPNPPENYIKDGYANGKEIFWIRSYMSNYSKWPEMRGLNLTDGGKERLVEKLPKNKY